MSKQPEHSSGAAAATAWIFLITGITLAGHVKPWLEWVTLIFIIVGATGLHFIYRKKT